MKIEYYNKQDENLNLFKVMQIPISKELIEDCYMLNPFDVPSELKLLFLEQVAEEFDKLILREAPNHVDKWILIDKLSKIEIKYKDAR